MGGNNTASNTIRLCRSDHLFDHVLLWKIHGNGQMALALRLMLNCERYRGRRSRLQYENARICANRHQSEIMQGNAYSTEPTKQTRELIARGQRGRRHSVERREEKSRTLLGNQHLLGHHHSEESKAKISQGGQGLERTEKARENIAAGACKRWLNPEARKQASEKQQGRTFSEETRNKMAASSKIRWERQKIAKSGNGV